jgi:hypothetical protein
MNCPPNCGCKVIMERNEQDIQTISKSINRMIWSVVVSSGMFVLYMLVVGANFILSHLLL